MTIYKVSDPPCMKRIKEIHNMLEYLVDVSIPSRIVVDGDRNYKHVSKAKDLKRIQEGKFNAFID